VTQPIPATKLLASHYRSGRGACGFVLVADPAVGVIWLTFTAELAVIHADLGDSAVSILAAHDWWSGIRRETGLHLDQL
jgi:hypothetical protein